MSEKQYLVALYAFTSFGPARTNLLINYFGSSKAAWNADRGKLREIGLSKKTVEKFNVFRKNFDLKEYFNRLKKLKIEYVIHSDDNYPENLRGLEGAPLVLYVLGRLKASDTQAVAMVGTRKMTSYGREVATKFAHELSAMGIVIISGLAFGVDAAAHIATIEAGGRGIAVLASGLDIITPASNTELAKRLVKGGGAIVSEYPLGTSPLRTFFPSRNRIISGLSKAVVVVEGARKSGTLLTASAAAEQGRQVFAVPGQITSPMSEASHYLIKNGAKMATNVEDIVEELDLQFTIDKEEVEKVMPSDKTEEKLVEILANEPLHLDDIGRISGLQVSDVSAKLTVMELKGMVKNIGNGVYKKI
jgi:DNA processing protein